MDRPPHPSQSYRIVFVHPDLGIGGSERLVVDAALALCEKSHEVTILTGGYHPSRCLRETQDGNLRSTPFPATIASRLRIP